MTLAVKGSRSAEGSSGLLMSQTLQMGMGHGGGMQYLMLLIEIMLYEFDHTIQ
jgi:hypothetical protein